MDRCPRRFRFTGPTQSAAANTGSDGNAHRHTNPGADADGHGNQDRYTGEDANGNENTQTRNAHRHSDEYAGGNAYCVTAGYGHALAKDHPE